MQTPTELRSRTMRAVKSQDTAPEMMVRRLVYSLGYRYRLHVKDLPGKPDLVFPGRRKVIFVHGCFWHQHSGCGEATPPKSNTDYWLPKLERNKQRDKEIYQKLENSGWKVLVIWECELRDKEYITFKIRSFIDE